MPNKRLLCTVLFAFVLVLGALGVSSAAEKVTIVLSGGTSDNIIAMLPLFEKQHPDIKVDYQQTADNEDYNQKMLLLMAAGTAPDVFLLDNPYIPVYAEENLALDLKKLSTQYSIPVGKYPKYVLDIFTRQGKVLALPKGFTPIVTYYNRDVLAKRGVTEPTRGWTWSDYTAKAKKLTQDANGDGLPEIWGSSFSSWNGTLIPQLWSWGSDILDPTGTKATGYFNSPKTMQFFQMIDEWVTSRIVPTAAQAANIQGGQLTSGVCAMGVSGHWAMYSFREYMEAGRYSMGVMHLPIGPYNTQPDTVIYSTGWAAWSGTKHPKEAIELVKFLAGVDYERKEALETLVEIPGHSDVIQEMLKTDKYNVEQEFVYASQFGRSPWGSIIRGFGNAQDNLIETAFTNWWSGGKPFPGEIENATGRLEAWLAENVRNVKK